MIDEKIRTLIQDSIQRSVQAKQLIPIDTLMTCAQVLISCHQDRHKLLIAGNGGSAADAQHMAAEFVGRYLLERKALPAIALTTNTSNLTAIGNDYGYEQVFSRQIDALGQKGDVFIAISTSGESENLLLALDHAHKIGMTTIGLTGRNGGRLGQKVQHHLNVAHPDTPRIQETHLLMIHILCDIVEKTLFQK